MQDIFSHEFLVHKVQSHKIDNPLFQNEIYVAAVLKEKISLLNKSLKRFFVLTVFVRFPV